MPRHLLTAKAEMKAWVASARKRNQIAFLWCRACGTWREHVTGTRYFCCSACLRNNYHVTGRETEHGK